MEVKELLERYKKGKRDFQNANLSGANLRWANLRWANLSGANLRWANLPAPTMMLLANWKQVSDTLCRDLMRYDAWCHDEPAAFSRWADGGQCPYNDKKFQRAANFEENIKLWSPGRPPKIFGLMVRCIREKCANSDWHEKPKEEK